MSSRPQYDLLGDFNKVTDEPSQLHRNVLLKDVVDIPLPVKSPGWGHIVQACAAAKNDARMVPMERYISQTALFFIRTCDLFLC